MKKIILTKKSPSPIGPFSQGIQVGKFLFTSGQLPIDPVTNEVVYNDIKKATTQCMENLKAIVEEAGFEMDDIVKTTVFIKDMKNFGDVNEVYASYFTGTKPARSCIEAPMAKAVEVEVEAIAYNENK